MRRRALPPRDLIYLDHPATTACDPRVIDAMVPWLGTAANAAQSTHAAGRAAGAAVEHARMQLAASVGLDPDRARVVFTSGATEANNLVLLGMGSTLPRGSRVIVSAIEHASVLAPARALAARGVDVVVLGVDQHGVVRVDELQDALDERVALVSVQAVNNETGVIQPIERIGELATSAGAMFHVDAVQAWGKVDLDLERARVDLLSVSSHKLHGPTGVGALIAVDPAHLGALRALHVGGAQEGGLRPGTTNVAGAVGFGEAARIARVAGVDERIRLERMRRSFELRLLDLVPGASINGARAPRGPVITSVSIEDIDARELLAGLPTIAASTTSACGGGAPSHVLRAMGRSTAQAASTIRFGIGRTTTAAQLEHATQLLAAAVERTHARSTSGARSHADLVLA